MAGRQAIKHENAALALENVQHACRDFFLLLERENRMYTPQKFRPIVLELVANLDKLREAQRISKGKKTGNTQQTRNFGPFLKWLRERGVRQIDHIRIAQTADGGYGVFTETPVKNGDVVVKLPSSLVLSSSDITKNPRLSQLLASDEIFHSELVCLALLLLDARFTPNSPWEPYTQILPKQINTPIFWTAEDWKAVFSLDSPYEANFAFLLANVARTYILLFSILVVEYKIFKNTVFTWENFSWAYGNATSRANRTVNFDNLRKLKSESTSTEQKPAEQQPASEPKREENAAEKTGTEGEHVHGPNCNHEHHNQSKADKAEIVAQRSALIQSRPFRLSFIPLADMFNHKPSEKFVSSSMNYNQETDEIEVYSSTDAEAGQEITMVYGKRTLVDHLLYQGFVPPVTDADSIQISLPLPRPNDPLAEKKLELCKAMGIEIPEGAKEVAFTISTNVLPWKAIAYMRVMVADNEGLLARAPRQPVDPTEKLPPITLENELQAVNLINLKLISLSNSEPTTLEQDKARLEQLKTMGAKASAAERLVLEGQVAEKSVKKRAQKLIEDYINKLKTKLKQKEKEKEKEKAKKAANDGKPTDN